MTSGLGPPQRVAVLGTGAWGTTLAILFVERGAQTSLLARTNVEAAGLQDERENRRFLPGIQLPEALEIATAPGPLPAADLIVLAVPAQTVRANLLRLRPSLSPNSILLSAGKGIELNTGLRLSEVIGDVLAPASPAVVVCSGPNLSAEIVRGLPAAAVLAAAPGRIEAARAVQELLSSARLRLYTSSDPVGVELGGALKNVIAIAAGVCDGLGYGNNARSALVTRGLAEMTRLAVAAGGAAQTLAGLAGLGDLMTTIASTTSRNYALGVALGQGRTPAEAIGATVHVAEGVATTPAALTLAARLGVKLPIAEQLDAILQGKRTAAEAAGALMRRTLGPE